MEEQKKRVEDHMTKMVEEIDKTYLRKMQVFLSIVVIKKNVFIVEKNILNTLIIYIIYIQRENYIQNYIQNYYGIIYRIIYRIIYKIIHRKQTFFIKFNKILFKKSVLTYRMKINAGYIKKLYKKSNKLLKIFFKIKEFVLY